MSASNLTTNATVATQTAQKNSLPKVRIPSVTLLANRAAKNYGSNAATEIRMIDGEAMQERAVKGESLSARVVKFDGYHAESRTGIRASMAALKRFWTTYHYVATVCVVAVPDIAAIYDCDTH